MRKARGPTTIHTYSVRVRSGRLGGGLGAITAVITIWRAESVIAEKIR
jgi:hypothetical protein